MFDDTKGVR